VRTRIGGIKGFQEQKCEILLMILLSRKPTSFNRGTLGVPD
jgi:hypothetical protein